MEPQNPPQPRKPYHTPELLDYGSFAVLTQNMKTAGPDSGPGTHSKP
jgi:hypothetical protein